MPTHDEGPLYFMAFDVVSQILERADDLDGVSHYVTSTFREMTGARGVCLFATDALDGQAKSRVLSVSPERNIQLLSHECCLAVEKLATFSRRQDVISFDRHNLESSGASRLADTYSTVAVFPLTVGSERFGSVMLFDLPEGGRRMEQILAFLAPVETLLALVLHHSMRFAHQEKVIEEKTRSLAKSESFYRLLFDSSPNAMVLAERDTGILREVNVSFSELSGRGFAELKGAHQSILHPSAEFPREGDFKGGFSRHQANSGDGTEDLLERPDGTTRQVTIKSKPIEVDGTPCVLGFFTDVTERNEQLEKLREREENFRTLFQQAADSILLLELIPDKPPVIRDVNNSTLALYGYAREELLGQPVTILDHERELKEELAARLISGGLATFEVKHYCKDGSVRLLDCAANLVTIGGKAFALSAERDITDFHRSELERVRLNEQLAQAQKMESVGRLAGGVAHDFNNMLGVILGHTEMALELVPASSQLQGDLLEIQKAAKRSADLTRQLLAFARKQTVSPKVLDLNETVAGMLSMLQRLIGENIQLEWRPGVKTWQINIDPSQIDQILANFCVNARDAIDDIGRITIETGNRSLDKDYCDEHHEASPGDYVLISVSDNGCGMSDETLAHIFEPFFTTKKMGSGTGLGLATIYGVVKQNKGFINVYSEPGIGTCFKSYLPRHIGKAVPGQPQSFMEPAKRGNEKILLVEDEPAICKMTAKMLTGLGYSVLTATTPGEAIRLAREHAGEINLLMTDVVMPEMNGRDLARNLLSLYPALKRLFMSGYTADVIAHQGVLDEGVNFIQKPFSIQELASVIRQALDD